MRSRHSIRRNIRKNIPSYDSVPVDTGALVSKVVGRIFAVVIAVTIPIGLLLAGFNIAFKLPDIYSFDLSRTMVTDKLDYDDEDKLISDLMSDYMSHKTDSFILRANVDGTTTSVFTKNDAATMKKYRAALDVTTKILYIFLPISALGYLLMILLSRKRALMYSMRAALLVYLGSIITAASMMLVKSNAANFTRDVMGVTTSRADILPQMFGTGLLTLMFVLATVISLIGILLIYALTSRLTHGPRL
jgi:hypothetical protein